MTTTLEGGEGSASRPGRSLPPGKTRYPLHRRLGGPQGWSGQVRKISQPPGFDPWTIQPIANRYTDWATRPTFSIVHSKYREIMVRLWTLNSWKRGYFLKRISCSFVEGKKSRNTWFYLSGVISLKTIEGIIFNTLRTGLLNCLNARSRGLTFRHCASCI